MDQGTHASSIAKSKKLGLGRKLLLGTALVTSLIAPNVAGMATASADTAARSISTLDVYPLQDDCAMTVIGYSDRTVDLVISCPESGDGENWF